MSIVLPPNYAQELERRVLSGGDTLVKRGVASAWRFGGYGGASIGAELGTIQMPFPPDVSGALAGKASASGAGLTGWHLGAIGVWQPVQSRLGAMLGVQFEQRSGRFLGTLDDNITNYRRIELHSALRYLSISPSVRWQLSEGRSFGPLWHCFGGMDVDVAIGSQVQPRLYLGTAADVAATLPALESGIYPVRLGVRAGVGVDIPFPDHRASGAFGQASTKASVKLVPQAILTPALTVHYGTPIAQGTEFVSVAWNQVFLRFSLAVTVSTPRVEEYTLPFNRQLLAQYEQLRNDQRRDQQSSSMSNERAPDLNDVNRVGGSETRTTVIPGQSEAFIYPTQQETALTVEIKRYLDAVAIYLKTRKAATVRLTGHTEAVGQTADKRRISEERAAAAAQYLLDKGIERQRITSSGAADREPAADNRTEAGRKRNRRLEVLVND
jgi:outer membrane protein OmpA-like peptidoglycan-associated protein